MPSRKKPVQAYVNIYEAKTKLSSLVARAADGEEITIAKAGVPYARLCPLPTDEEIRTRRVGGKNLLGITYMSPDWDAPMTEEELADWGM